MRPDTNSLALRVTRVILDAAHDFRFEVEGSEIAVAVERLPAAPWPTAGLDGLTLAKDAPWPQAARLKCTWLSGAVTVLLQASYVRGTGQYRHLAALSASVPAARQKLLWITTGLPLRDAADGAEVVLEASFVPFGSHGTEEDPAPRSLAARVLVERAGFTLVGESKIEACRLSVPELTMTPTAPVVFERLVRLSLLKLPFFLRNAEGVQGSLPFSIPKVASTDGEARPPVAPSTKRAGIWPLPGGVRSYKETLDALLAQLGEEGLSIEAFYDVLKSQYDVTGDTSVKGYVGVLTGLEYCTAVGGEIRLTEAGHIYLRNPTVDMLFDRLHKEYIGVLDLLVIADAEGKLDSDRASSLLKRMLGVTWQSANQVSFRRNWLLSLGLTDRDADGDAVTPTGRSVLDRHAEEVTAIRHRLETILDERFTPSGDDDGDEDEVIDEVTPSMVPPKPGKGEPSAWAADRVDLRPEMLARHASALALPENVLERAAAALSAGKHLLLVGPPGTGKTEIAHAIAEAARSEGYCTGAFVSTACADWTTFDTIGGYALSKDGSLKFRSGALLRAIEQWQWLIIDEINRADVDRAFGELMTVLAGRTSDTAFEREDGRLIRIGPDSTATHPMPKTFRLIATMNTWDKTSLFRLSYAVQRRFAMLDVGIPDDATYGALVRRHAEQQGIDPPFAAGAIAPVAELFSTRGLLRIRHIGPAVALDVIRYVRRRASGRQDLTGVALAEALSMCLLPQLEGLDQDSAVQARDVMMQALAGWTSLEARTDLHARMVELFPHVKWPSA